MKYSLRNYLLLSILLTLVIIGSSTLFGGYRASVHEVEELFDAQLSRSARLMLGLALAEVKLGHMKGFSDNVQENRFTLVNKKHIEEEVYKQGHFYELKLAYQIWDSYGNMLLRSENAPIEPMSDLQQGYANKNFNQQNWRTFSLWDINNQFQVITAEQQDVRNDLVKKITLQMTWPFVLLLPVMAGLILFFVNRGLKPLELIAREISNRQSQRLEPLSFDHVPAEIQPVLDELNHLFLSLQLSFEKERQFTSDAAHELRTPLAALKTHLQLFQSTNDSLDNADKREKTLESIIEGIDRASRLVDQLLGLARLDAQAIEGMHVKEKIDLSQLCIDAMADIYPLAHDKNQSIELEAKVGISICGYEFALQSMLMNLLSNSVNYSPQSGEIILELKQTVRTIEIILHDSGPGIPEKQRNDVLSRFKKVKGNTQGGSGIGLSIVKRVAELHGMQLQLKCSNRLDGLCVHLQFDVDA